MGRTMMVDVGDAQREFIDSLVSTRDYRTQSLIMRNALHLLREKQAESRLKDLCDLLAEGLCGDNTKPWNKDVILSNIGPGWQMKEIELTPRAEEDLEAFWD